MKDATERARLASAIVDNPLFDEALSVMREAYLAGALKCGPTEDKARFLYLGLIAGMKVFREHLEGVLKTGEVTAEQIKMLREAEKREGVFTRVVRGLWSDDINTERPLDVA